MKLRRFECAGLEGFSEFVFDDLKKINVLTGPNGTGKTTSLRVLKLGLDILSRKTIKGNMPDCAQWDIFSRAKFFFEVEDGDIPENFFVLEPCKSIEINIECNSKEFFIDSIIYGEEIKISTSHPIEYIQSQEQEGLRVKEQINSLEKLRYIEQTLSARQDTNVQLKRAADSLILIKDNLEPAMYVLLKIADEDRGMDRHEVDSIIGQVKFPSAFMVDSSKAISEIIPTLIEDFCRLKSGNSAKNKIFNLAQKQLEHLLQHAVDFFDSEDEKHLTVNGIDYRHASTGTHVSLAYFGLTNTLGTSDVVLWDEPENGLHPTRRIRVLDLIKSDARTFFIATHALEFAPVFYPNGKVFRCDSVYEEDAPAPALTIRDVTTRGDVFRLLESLGVQAARTLFTANVILWVEGPTELIFYRHWLRMAFEGTDIEEGFHYTIMHYGGGLISYLDANDDFEHDRESIVYDLLSLCRNPIIVVDSDIKKAPKDGNVFGTLKPAAKKISDQIQKINIERPGAGLFCATRGREVENYLPTNALWHAVGKCWKGYSKHQEDLPLERFSFGQYDSFDQAIGEFLIANNICESSDIDDSKLPLGRSKWGASNKVEMMRAALEFPGLTSKDLGWDFSSEIDVISNFITKVCEG